MLSVSVFQWTFCLTVIPNFGASLSRFSSSHFLFPRSVLPLQYFPVPFLPRLSLLTGQAQSEKREADRKRHLLRVHRRMDAEAAVKKVQLQKQKAILAKRAALVSGIKKKQKSVRTSPYFRRPKSLELKSIPKYPKKSVPSKPELNQVRFFCAPLSRFFLRFCLACPCSLVFFSSCVPSRFDSGFVRC